MRTINLTEDEVGVLFQAVFNEVTSLEVTIANARTEEFKTSMEIRLKLLETVSKKVMHGRRVDALDALEKIVDDDAY
ncbi:MAG: hypothetical protein ACK5XN_23205 [Bacteroidota bacterium]|jgi:hypothetical protein